MLTRRRSAVSTVKTPAEVVSVTCPDHSLNRPGSPGPLSHRSVVPTMSVAWDLDDIDAGATVVGRLLPKPTSPVMVELTMCSVAEVEIVRVEPPACASMRMPTEIGVATEPSGQTTTVDAK